MAYINVAEWSPEQVTDWLKGLDKSVNKYINSFTNNEVGGNQLLNIRPYELEQLGMYCIGHQEIVLEAVENLRNFHYNLDKENLQFLALHVATAARNLYKRLGYCCDKSQIETEILNDISKTIATIKPVIGWLDRSPFQGQLQFIEIRKNMLRLGLEMATVAQRDRFVENPVEPLQVTAETLAKLADYIIQDISDPMLLQPGTLSLVTLKKRESELGFNIISSYQGIHRVSDIKYNSPAHNSGKIEDGDEIVQINYQTVVGWQDKTVIFQLRESPPDVLLTLKKRPKHTKIYGQIYMKPYRLPSKKRSMPYRWGDNLPSPRTDFLAVHDYSPPLKMKEKNNSSDTELNCSDILTPTDTKASNKELHLYLPKPRPVLQRRNTICGDEFSNLKNIGTVPFWHERKARQNGDASSPSLRDKSVSFGFGLELTPRPTTCLGIAGNGKFSEMSNTKKSLPENSADKQKNESVGIGDEGKHKLGISKVVRFDANMKYNEYSVDNKYTCNVENTILETFEPIPFADEDDLPIGADETKPERNSSPKPEGIPIGSSNPVPKRRGKLEKSYSTPAYDDSSEISDIPPAIEPRKDFLVAPVPPPRPKKPNEVPPPAAPPPPPKPKNLMQNVKVNEAKAIMEVTNAGQSNVTTPTVLPNEESELVTPSKTKSLTSRKKSHLIAKRRKVCIKALGTSDIQGHLYRRMKDRNGFTFWAKLYFVLIETVLYGFRNKESQKASCMVILPGLTISLAKEVHSKSFAFKVYHPLKTLYFATESVEALNQWMDFIRQATLQDNLSPIEVSDEESTKHFYSETDSSGDESDQPTKQFSSQLVNSNANSGSSLRDIMSQNKDPMPRHDKYLVSLRKFTKTSLPFKGSGKKSSDIPVPTAQSRVYRKVPGGNFGLQIGTSTNQHPLENLASFQSSLESKKLSASSIQSLNFKVSQQDLEDSNESKVDISNHKKMKKTSPYNYIHASNPNLVDFDFPTSKALDFSLPKMNPSNSWDAHNNLQGFVTLKDLMLKKQEEEAQEMYNNRVLLGVEKKDDRSMKQSIKPNRLEESIGIPETGKVSKIQSRSLPKTPDYAMSFKPDDEDIRRIRAKEGLKLRDFGYEHIFEPNGTNENARGSYISSSQQNTSKKKGSSVDPNEKSGRGGSFKKTKGKFEAFKNSSEKLFQFIHSSNDCELKPLKVVPTYCPMTLPLNKKSTQLYNIQMDQAHGQINMKKSHTCFSDFKEKKVEGQRKNSAPVPIFSKFTFSGVKTPKEKKLLGSPRLHRAIFGRTHSTSSNSDVDHEIFSPVVFGRHPSASSEIVEESQPTEPSVIIPERKASIVAAPAHTTPEYPNMECPPVFEPETYSLSDPNASFTLLRRRSNNVEGK